MTEENSAKEVLKTTQAVVDALVENEDSDGDEEIVVRVKDSTGTVNTYLVSNVQVGEDGRMQILAMLAP